MQNKAHFSKLKEHPANKRKLQSEQWKYSEMLMDIRLEKGLTFEDIANKANISKEEYMKLEWCDLKTPVSVYKSVLSNLEALFRENKKV